MPRAIFHPLELKKGIEEFVYIYGHYYKAIHYHGLGLYSTLLNSTRG